MCHYVLGTLPARVALADARFDRLGFHPTPLDNPDLARQLAPGERLVRWTSGHCDCGTLIGSALRRPSPARAERELAALQKKGWSEAKIGRWKASKQEAANTRSQRREATAGLRWPELFAESPVPLGLLLHWFHGSLRGELIPLRRTERIPAATCGDETLANLEEDVLYRFVPDGQ